MEDRLQWIRLQPQSWAHWDPVRGGVQAHALLTARYPQADCFIIQPPDNGPALAAARELYARKDGNGVTGFVAADSQRFVRVAGEFEVSLARDLRRGADGDAELSASRSREDPLVAFGEGELRCGFDGIHGRLLEALA